MPRLAPRTSVKKSGKSPLTADRPRQVLYSPEILAAAVRLADYPADPDLPLVGDARSRSCGSTLAMRVETDRDGVIVRAGCRAQACAVGQAAASIFLDGAAGKRAQEIERSRSELAAWLGRAGPMPEWPGLELLEPARDYPARHGAIMLAWDAALAALASANPVR